MTLEVKPSWFLLLVMGFGVCSSARFHELVARDLMEGSVPVGKISGQQPGLYFIEPHPSSVYNATAALTTGF